MMTLAAPLAMLAGEKRDVIFACRTSPNDIFQTIAAPRRFARCFDHLHSFRRILRGRLGIQLLFFPIDRQIMAVNAQTVHAVVCVETRSVEQIIRRESELLHPTQQAAEEPQLARDDLVELL